MSGLRYNDGKLRWSLVDFDSLEDMVRVLEFGAKKYEDLLVRVKGAFDQHNEVVNKRSDFLGLV